MRRAKALAIYCLIALLILTGCTKKSDPVTSGVPNSRPTEVQTPKVSISINSMTADKTEENKTLDAKKERFLAKFPRYRSLKILGSTRIRKLPRRWHLIQPQLNLRLGLLKASF